MEHEIIAAVITSVVAFFVVYLTTPLLIKDLEKRNQTVKDYHRKGGAMIARPGGPSIIAGILASEFTLLVFFPTNEIIAIIITTSIACIIGLIDDKKV
ncbi:MAG: UDP-N-acetylglucosamine-1-phosphate transferase, partial [Nitrosopumilaceae archaeon]